MVSILARDNKVGSETHFEGRTMSSPFHLTFNQFPRKNRQLEGSTRKINSTFRPADLISDVRKTTITIFRYHYEFLSSSLLQYINTWKPSSRQDLKWLIIQELIYILGILLMQKIQHPWTSTSPTHHGRLDSFFLSASSLQVPKWWIDTGQISQMADGYTLAGGVHVMGTRWTDHFISRHQTN